MTDQVLEAQAHVAETSPLEHLASQGNEVDMADIPSFTDDDLDASGILDDDLLRDLIQDTASNEQNISASAPTFVNLYDAPL